MAPIGYWDKPHKYIPIGSTVVAGMQIIDLLKIRKEPLLSHPDYLIENMCSHLWPVHRNYKDTVRKRMASPSYKKLDNKDPYHPRDNTLAHV